VRIGKTFTPHRVRQSHSQAQESRIESGSNLKGGRSIGVESGSNLRRDPIPIPRLHQASKYQLGT